VVPSYNYARFLPDCVRSALTQERVDVNVVIVDDCSVDDTPRVTAELELDPRVSVIRNERNRGMIPSVNEGLAHVDSEYVVKLDADDLLASGALARATAALDALPSVAFVYGQPLHFSGAVPVRSESPAKSWTVWSGHEWLARRCRSGRQVISQPEVVMRTSAARRAGEVRADLGPMASDLHFWLTLASIGDVGRVNGTIQGYYRVHDASMQRTVCAGELVTLRARRDAFDAVLEAAKPTLAGADVLRATARRSLASEALRHVCHAYDRGHAEDPAELDAFVAFALETWPAARQLREWRALEHRKSVGARWAPRHPRFIADAVLRRAGADIARWRWLRTGEL
jgi:hypothetical protein